MATIFGNSARIRRTNQQARVEALLQDAERQLNDVFSNGSHYRFDHGRLYKRGETALRHIASARKDQEEEPAMNDTKQERPLGALGLANEAELGNLLWKLHQQWMYEDNPNGGDEVLASQAALGRQVNQLLLGWMDRVLAREGVRKDQADMLMTLAPTLEMARRRVA